MVVALVLLALASACSRSAALPARALKRCHAQQPCAEQSRSDRITSRALAMVNDRDEKQGLVGANSQTYCGVRVPQPMGGTLGGKAA